MATPLPLLSYSPATAALVRVVCSSVWVTKRLVQGSAATSGVLVTCSAGGGRAGFGLPVACVQPATSKSCSRRWPSWDQRLVIGLRLATLDGTGGDAGDKLTRCQQEDDQNRHDRTRCAENLYPDLRAAQAA